MAEITNKNMEKGTLAEVIKGADVFIGVSAPGTLTKEMVQTMAKDPIIFACANPTPEIFRMRQRQQARLSYLPEEATSRIR